MKAYLKTYKLLGLLALILQLLLYVFSLYVLVAPTPLSRFVQMTFEKGISHAKSSFLLAYATSHYEIRGSGSSTGGPTVHIDPSTFTTQSEQFKKRREAAAPGETLEGIALDVYGMYVKRKQAVGIWGDSLHGSDFKSYDVNLILDSSPNGFKMHEIWQPYVLRPVYLLLDYLTILASLLLLQFTLFFIQFAFTQVRTHLRKKSRLCSKCAYPLLKTNADTTCPECGQLNPVFNPDTPV